MLKSNEKFQNNQDRKSYESLELSLVPLADTEEVSPSKVDKGNDKYISNFGQQLFNKEEIGKSCDAAMSALDLITLDDDEDENDIFTQEHNDVIG